MNLIAVGEKKIDNEDEARHLIRPALSSIKPTLVMSSFESGWDILVADEAMKLGYRVMGVLPHEEVIGQANYKEFRRSIVRRVISQVVFAESYIEFLGNPKPYVAWVTNSVDAALCYVDTQRSSTPHSLMVHLSKSGKKVYNMHRSAT